MSQPKRTGFTLVELLVVIAIIGILIGMLLPAVQQVRESARRTTCMNKIRQLGLAIHNYESSHEMVPHSEDWRGPKQTGWIVKILPFMEQVNIFDQLGEKDFDLRSSPEVYQYIWEALNCPSDDSSRVLSDSQYQWEGTCVATTNYKGVVGDPRMSTLFAGSPDTHSTSPNVGMFWRHSHRHPVGFNQITDGLSNTNMLGEDLPRYNDHTMWSYSNGDWSGCSAPPNFKPEPPTPRIWRTGKAFRSEHPGGVSFCRADSSTSFISDSIDHTLYRALSTKAGGELINE